MHYNLLAFAIPLFLIFMAGEYFYSKSTGKNFFHFAESTANLNVGIAERLLDVFATGLFYFFFDYIYTHYALFSIQSNVATWILLFLLTDLVWYWYHRLAHEINAFWAAHVVHHQSEDFNYTVSARITVFQAIIRSGFWGILPLLGFPPLMITSLLLIHGMYPFFIHTQTLGKWGWLEKILVTPTHHGIHHASNPEYLDKNYGDVLIIWDKIFGSFAAENKDIKITYGLTKPLESHSFLWQHFHFGLEILINFYHARGWKAKWRVLFGKPDDLDPRYRALLERKLLKHRMPKSPPTRFMRIYVTIQTTVSLVLLFLILLFIHHLPVTQVVLGSCFILLSIVNSGAILDQRRWITYLEIARVYILLLALYLIFPSRLLLAISLYSIPFVLVFFGEIKMIFIRRLYGFPGRLTPAH
ncbi:sterol desaturase family protein [Niabella terrae]